MSASADPPSPRGPSVGLVGCGRWGGHILRDLVSLGCAVHVVARSAATRQRAHSGGASSVVGSLGELPAVEGAVVATLTSTHAEVLEELLARVDVPVFVEKPLTTEVETAERLLTVAGDRLFVMDKWRYHPGIRELGRIRASGELGVVQSLHLRRVSDRDPHHDVDTVWTHAPHDLAITQEILGALPPAVHATQEVLAGERVGMIGTLGGPPWVTIEVSCVAPGHRRELRMVCEDGVALLDGGWSDSLTIVRPGGDPDAHERRVVEGELPLLAELRAFVAHLLGGPPPLSPAADAVEVVRRIEELGRLAAELDRQVAAA